LFGSKYREIKEETNEESLSEYDSEEESVTETEAEKKSDDTPV